MYKSFFGLKSKPFRLNPHLRFLFNSEAIQRAVNTLKYGLYQREGLVLLTDSSGQVWHRNDGTWRVAATDLQDVGYCLA